MQALNAVGLVENLFLYFPASVPWENMILYTPTMGEKVVLLG